MNSLFRTQLKLWLLILLLFTTAGLNLLTAKNISSVFTQELKKQFSIVIGQSTNKIWFEQKTIQLSAEVLFSVTNSNTRLGRHHDKSLSAIQGNRESESMLSRNINIAKTSKINLANVGFEESVCENLMVISRDNSTSHLIISTISQKPTLQNMQNGFLSSSSITILNSSSNNI